MPESSVNYPGSVITLFIYQFNEDYISLRDNNTWVALWRNFEPSKKFPDAKDLSLPLWAKFITVGWMFNANLEIDLRT